MTLFPELEAAAGATFSGCRQYRYRLWRWWGPSPSYVNFLMLNPSTADEVANDPTVERCERRARAWGHDGLVVTNLFALRATDPSDMKRHAEPVGVENDATILRAAAEAEIVVCAWGNHGAHQDRAEHVVRLLREAGVMLHALKITGAGQPQHPLYLPYDVQPEEWRG